MSKLRSASATKPIARDEFESLWGRGTPLNGQRTPRVQRITNSNNYKSKCDSCCAPECKNSQFIIPTLILSYLNLRAKLILAVAFYLMSPCTIKDVFILHVFILLITICTNIFLHPYFLMVVYSTKNDHIYAVLATFKYIYIFFLISFWF